MRVQYSHSFPAPLLVVETRPVPQPLQTETTHTLVFTDFLGSHFRVEWACLFKTFMFGFIMAFHVDFLLSSSLCHPSVSLPFFSHSSVSLPFFSQSSVSLPPLYLSLSPPHSSVSISLAIFPFLLPSFHVSRALTRSAVFTELQCLTPGMHRLDQNHVGWLDSLAIGSVHFVTTEYRIQKSLRLK